MLKTAKQIAISIGHTEQCVLLAIRKIGIAPTEIKPHAGKSARYYDEAAQKSIISQAILPRAEKIRQNGKVSRKKNYEAASSPGEVVLLVYRACFGY